MSWMSPRGRIHFHPHGTAYRDDFSHADPARLRAQLAIAPDDQILLVVPGSGM